MSTAPKLKSRYEIRERLPKQGAMGVVYKAWDLELKRYVVVKTIGDARNRLALEHFRQEWEVLAKINHANIVDIYDIGEMEADGQLKPFFVMPMLPGATLEQLIAERRTSAEQMIEIIIQVCRGLHAAHERGVIHRDIKPSNIFVIDDQGTVKIIDFGIAHLTDNTSSVGLKGTLLYMSPEQVQMKTLVPASDVFSLAVVCYEALSNRRPFEGGSQEEIAYRILHHVPPPVSDFNPTVSLAVGQVVHAAMAKQVHHRFATAREFGDALLKALHNKPIDRFDPKKVEPRIRKAEKALDSRQIDIAAEMLGELEAEGHLQPEIRQLRRQVDQFVKDRAARQHLDNARQYIEAEEYPLAMQKVQLVLDENPGHPEALAIKARIEKDWTSQQVAEWMRLAREHLDNQSFPEARKALQSVMALRPADSQALSLLTEIGRVEEQVERVRRESAELFQVAQDAFRKGDISAALSNAERVLDFDKLVPDKSSPELASMHQEFYNRVRSEHEAILGAVSEVRRLLGEKNFAAAAAVCDRFLARYPDSPQFRALRLDVDQKERQYLSAAIARIDRETDAEPDLGRRVAMLDEALKQWPGEEHFRKARKAAVELRDLVQAVVTRAREHERSGHFQDALAQMESLRTIHPLHPGLEEEIARLGARRQEQVRADARVRWLRQGAQFLDLGNYTEAARAAQMGLAEFPGDADLTALGKAAAERRERSQEVERLVAEGHALVSRGEYQAGLDLLAKAFQLDPKNAAARTVYADSLLKRAGALKESDPFQAEECVNRALEVDPASAAAAELKARLAERKRQMAVGAHLDKARRLEEQGDRKGALTEVLGGLRSFPGDPNLTAFQKTMEAEIAREKAAAAPPAPVSSKVGPGDKTTVFTPADLPVTGKTAGGTRAPVRPRWFGWKAGAMVAALVVIAGLLAWLAGRGGTPTQGKPSGETVAGGDVELTVRPANASARVYVNGSPVEGTVLKLAPREQEYEIEARLAGYRSTTERVMVRPGATLAPLDLKLEALPTRLEMALPMRATLNGQDVNGPQELKPGNYTLELTADGVSMTVQIAADTGRQPGVAVVNKGVPFYTLVTTLGSEGQVELPRAPRAATVDDKPIDPLGPKMALTGLTAGEHALRLEGGGPLKFEASDAPRLLLMAWPGSNTGNLTLQVTDEGATVKLTGQSQVQPQVVKDRKVSFGNLKPGVYVVEISRDGYETRKEEVTVAKGNNAPATIYTLQAVKAPAKLSATGGVPNALITVDGVQVGRVDTSGQFGPKEIGTGTTTFVLTHERYETKTFKKNVSLGEDVKLTPEEMRMVPILGIELQNRVAGCSYRYRLKGTAAWTPGGAGTLRVSRAGVYEVECVINGVTRGRKEIPVNDSVVASEIPVGAAPVVTEERKPITQGTQSLVGLVNDKDGWLKGTALMNGKVESGEFAFTVQFPKSMGGIGGRRPARWIVRSAGTGGCLEFELSADKFAGGPCEIDKKTPKPNPAKTEKAQFFQVRMLIRGGSIVQEVAAEPGLAWLPLDSRPAPSGPVEFRFRETTLKNFSFRGFLAQ